MKEVITVIAATHHYLWQTNKWCFLDRLSH